MRLFLSLICGALIGAAAARADEHVIVSGGCALTYFEKHKPKPHDKYWGNFIDAAAARIAQIQPAPGDQITWLVYRPAYAARGREENANLLAAIRLKATQTRARLFWFDSQPELLNHLNKGADRDRVKIARFEYFGHSNMLCLMFDYSNGLDGAAFASGILHQNDLGKINRAIFAKTARAQSWGCHSGESYSAEWKKRTGIPMVGAIGKTDYSRGGLPFLSSPNGKWSQ
ncbi:MAG: hypothetical protein LBD30_03975 [Verrucomicrobiales bacterium]|jgi:hypothetical protein|nr:hypothetical protein [Verrucomicrobiales bacterium]